jgi:hypothetical protein
MPRFLFARLIDLADGEQNVKANRRFLRTRELQSDESLLGYYFRGGQLLIGFLRTVEQSPESLKSARRTSDAEIVEVVSQLKEPLVRRAILGQFLTLSGDVGKMHERKIPPRFEKSILDPHDPRFDIVSQENEIVTIKYGGHALALISGSGPCLGPSAL